MWVIAKREFIERVRSKWFIVMTIAWPILMVGMIVVPALIGSPDTKGAKVDLVDKSGKLGEPMVFQLGVLLGWETKIVPADTDEKALRARIKSHEIHGYVMIPKDALDGGQIIYNGDNASNQAVALGFGQVAQSVVIGQRAKRLGLSEVDLALLVKKVDVSVRHTSGEEEGSAAIVVFLTGFSLAMLLYIVITLYGVGVMRSVVTEKSNRIVELLVAATNPRSMMAGKIVGVGSAGLAQLMIWLVVGAALHSQQQAILDLFHAGSGAKRMLPTLTGDQFAVTIAFFIGGYLFYAAMFAAVGAMVSNEQDTQQAQMPVTFLLAIAILSLTAVISDPQGQTAKIMTIVPFWSSMLMPPRYFLGGASGADVGLSLAVLAISTVVMARIAGRIYKVGILMYGKRPSLRELIRWLRYQG
jgi:ABC-2 type transport system permease protein